VLELLFDGNRGQLATKGTVQEGKFLASFAGLIAQGKVQINSLIVRGSRERLRGLFAGFGAQKEQRGLIGG
jgi:hypothetical protein